MLRRTRSHTKLEDKPSQGIKRKNSEDAENIASPPRTPKRSNSENEENTISPPRTPKRRERSPLQPVTPQPIRNLTKELSLSQLKSSHSQSVYLKTEPSSATLYQKAKTVFRRTAIPSRLIGREKEREILLKFWLDHVMNNHPGCMYISGMPGTGKTAMLNEIMRMTEDDIMALRSHKVKIMVINCMSIQEPKKIYLRLVEDMKSASSLIQSDIIKQAETLINSDKHRMNVVVLDEIDSLITKEQEVLYRLFEWASLPDSRLVLIGVANALDLTDRILPRLRAKNCEPQLLNFNPYQVSEISAIIKDRLYSLREDPENMFGPAPPPEKDTPIPLVHPSAIELCARKVAASMGDLRTALDVCRQAIGLAETEREKKAVLGEKAPNGVAKSVPTVTIAHVMRVLNGVFGSPIIQKLKQLNIQQKVVLGVFVVMLRLSKGPKKDQLTMGKFREQYNLLCFDTESSIVGVSRSELNDLLSMLETNGIITLGKSKEDRLKKIQLNVQETEITQVLNEMPILKIWMERVLLKCGL